MFFFFFSSVGVDMGSPELRQRIVFDGSSNTNFSLNATFRAFLEFLSSELHFPLGQAGAIVSDPSCFVA